MAVATLLFHPDWRNVSEWHLLSWLQERQEEHTGLGVELDAIERVTAANPSHLPKEQANLTQWLSKKYRVAPEPIGAIVAQAYETGRKVRLEPTLILAVMAIESGFNPFAQSPVGAQGLMQVMTKVHSEKYEHFGGKLAAFDPLSNLRVGTKVLVDCIAKAGSIEGGLRQYLGTTSNDDGGYTAKVLQEQERMRDAAKGQIKIQVALK
ncbi:MAG: lytic transglycosylase domain-containing protein [Cytophagales bacterium]|nr:lytic transglycosylase domain-containing protein [Cytophagales bacterium]